MKMKEVCARTGLTERTIRFYVEEKLIEPRMSLVNGREYRDYSERDIAELTTVADLRKLFFSIDEIKKMKQSPDKIAEVVEAYKINVSADVQAKAEILQALAQIEVSRLNGVDKLAQRLKSVSANLPLPKRDITPNFGQYDSETKEEREREYERYLKRQKRQYAMGKAIVFTIAGINVVSTILSSFVQFNLFALIIQVALSIALVAGVTWIRYLFAVGAALSVLSHFYVLTGGYDSNLMTAGLAVLIIVQIAYSIAACLLLLINNAVKDFLYAQKNG
ncbi:helix-turn-helix domain-containing protein [Cohnella cholangitidis]|uniref:MerR family transcriptional regulator n=1 Tax=Cohnella cholangitidis TaxID=2598458 RepID=A0A7G5BW87_9BACL|nr:MerR family transcriptional regulator [Cohnella cholangitidis]QMV41221.1 MerR family transcriptional regulator [Cohnella cholangitidis]